LLGLFLFEGITENMMIYASGYNYCCGGRFQVTHLLKSRNAYNEVDAAMVALHHVSVGSAGEVSEIYAASICSADTSVMKMPLRIVSNFVHSCYMVESAVNHHEILCSEI
jgi:hypothetical protein